MVNFITINGLTLGNNPIRKMMKNPPTKLGPIQRKMSQFVTPVSVKCGVPKGLVLATNGCLARRKSLPFHPQQRTFSRSLPLIGYISGSELHRNIDPRLSLRKNSCQRTDTGPHVGHLAPPFII
jgi:hypothetical protein